LQILRQFLFDEKLQTQTLSKNFEKAVRKMVVKLNTAADAINISGLLNPKKLGNFKNRMV